MNDFIVVTDRETAHGRIAEMRGENVGLLQFQPGRALDFTDEMQLMVVSTASGTAVVARNPPATKGVWSVRGVSTAHGVEVIHSLVCGYGLRLLVIEGIEHLLRDPEAMAKLRGDLSRISDAATQCQCPVWIVEPRGANFAGFTRSPPQVEQATMRRRADTINHLMLTEGMDFEAAYEAYTQRERALGLTNAIG